MHIHFCSVVFVTRCHLVVHYQTHSSYLPAHYCITNSLPLLHGLHAYKSVYSLTYRHKLFIIKHVTCSSWKQPFYLRYINLLQSYWVLGIVRLQKHEILLNGRERKKRVNGYNACNSTLFTFKEKELWQKGTRHKISDVRY